MADTKTDVAHDPESTCLEIVESLPISADAADEISSELSGDLGLVKDHTYDEQYYIVRWHDGE